MVELFSLSGLTIQDGYYCMGTDSIMSNKPTVTQSMDEILKSVRTIFGTPESASVRIVQSLHEPPR
jgi:hypothetical protein